MADARSRSHGLGRVRALTKWVAAASVGVSGIAAVALSHPHLPTVAASSSRPPTLVPTDNQPPDSQGADAGLSPPVQVPTQGGFAPHATSGAS